MSLIRRERFERAWRDADPETRTAFVAGLFDARGYTVERTDDRHLSLRDEGRVVAVDPPEAEKRAATVDTVVGVDPDPDAGDARIIGLDSIHEMLCFAIDRGVARDLLATHLGVDTTRMDDPTGVAQCVGESAGGEQARAADATQRERVGEDAPESAPAGSAGRRFHGLATGSVSALSGVGPVDWTVSRAAIAVVGVVVLVVAVGLVGLTGAFPAGPGSGDRVVANESATPVDVTPVPEQTPQTDAANEGPGTPAAEPHRHHDRELLEEQRAIHPYAPGLEAWGIEDATRLAEAHETELANTSYTVQLRYQEFVDGRQTGVYVETVRVENRSRYSISTNKLGTLETSPRSVAGTDVFVNGDERHVSNVADLPRIRTGVTTSDIREWTERYLRWSLSVRNSTIRDQRTISNVTTFVVTTDGDPFPGVQDVSGIAYVTESGLVKYGRWSYRKSTPQDTRVVFTIQTTRVGETTVTRPAWVDAE